MPTRIYEIIRKYFDHPYSDRVQKEFTFWVKDATDEAEKEAAFQNIWNNLEIQPDESTAYFFDSLRSQIRAKTPESRKTAWMHTFSRIAAFFLLPLISVAITWFIMKDQSADIPEIRLVECIVPHGEIRTLILPDSSVVKVNSGSILIYPEQFSSKRDIFLNGEAYFTVARNEAKPFVVKTTDMEVEVLGTVFNLSSYTDSERSSTTLKSGKVSVRFRDANKEAVVLQPSEQVTYNRQSGTVEKNMVKVENAIAWTQGNLIIQSMPIDEIAKIIERKYALKVNLNSHKYQDERITIKAINDESITEFMSALSYLLPQLTYKIEGDTLYIY